MCTCRCCMILYSSGPLNGNCHNNMYTYCTKRSLMTGHWRTSYNYVIVANESSNWWKLLLIDTLKLNRSCLHFYWMLQCPQSHLTWSIQLKHWQEKFQYQIVYDVSSRYFMSTGATKKLKSQSLSIKSRQWAVYGCCYVHCWPLCWSA